MSRPLSLSAVTCGESSQPSIVILHGLLGSSRNWAGMLKLLAPDYDCHALDLRNHGDSPHADSMVYADQATDVVAYLDSAGIDRCILIGHSMGGKVAMAVSASAPTRVSHLVVVDIAPKAYAPRWQAEFAAMRALELASMRSRAEAESALEPAVPDWAFRKFLLSNIVRRPEGGFAWKVNLPLHEASLPEIFAHSLAENERYEGPSLFIGGEHSDYVTDEDMTAIKHHFPFADRLTVEGAGHNVHFEKPEAFVQALTAFVAS